MADLEIRPLTQADDMDAQVDLVQCSFGPMSAAEREDWVHVASIRVRQGAFLGAFVDGRPAGSGVVHDMRQWWHGRAVPSAGIASVKVAPEHRGQGIGRRLMTAVLGLIAERGYPLSALYPATMPLYRSLGWELAGGRYQAVVPARSLRSLLAPDPASGAGQGGHGGTGHGGTAAALVRRAGPADAAAMNTVIGRCHQAARDSGPLTWDLELAARMLSGEGRYAYLTGEGFAAYRWGDGPGELFVERVVAASADALRALWSVIASHCSVARTVRVRTGPADPLWWLTHERDAAITRRSMWMLRVVDAPAAIGARGFPPGVRLTAPLVIVDHARPANSGCWELTVSEGKGILIPNGPGILRTATSLTAPGGQPATGGGGPALTLGARGLAALYAGTPVATLRLAGLASGGSPDADAALDAAFAARTFMLDDF